MKFLVATILVAAVTILGTSMFATTAASTTAAPGTLSFIWEGDPPKYCLNRFDEYSEGAPCEPYDGPPPEDSKDSKDSEIDDATGCFDCRYTDSKVTSHDYCETVDDYTDGNDYPIVWTAASCKCDYANDRNTNPPENCPLNNQGEGGRTFQCKCDESVCDKENANGCPYEGDPQIEPWPCCE
jgi:hypothetical protein